MVFGTSDVSLSAFDSDVFTYTAARWLVLGRFRDFGFAVRCIATLAYSMVMECRTLNELGDHFWNWARP